MKLKPVLHLLWNERIIFFSMVVINLYTTTNVVLLGFLQNTTQVGYYTAGWKLIMIVQTLISIPLGQALFPFVGAAFGQGKEKGLNVVRQLFPIVVSITASASLFLFIFGPTTISLVYGAKFEPTVLVFRVLAFIPMMISISNLLGVQTMINLKMDKIFFRITAFGAITSLLLNFILVKKFGFVGTAWSWLLTETFITIAMFITLTRKGIHVLDRKYFAAGHFKKYLKPIYLSVKHKIIK